MTRAINDATSQKAGDIYQYLIALRDCFELNDGDTLQIETTGDVSIINDMGGRFQKEVKHHIGNKSISDRDIDFWKTLANWYIDYERVKTFSNFILSTTATIQCDSPFYSWNSTDDEVILCLNYDGLYGINNINRFLQSNNKNPAIEWGLLTYKIGDRILFNESQRFSPLIYNNMKGIIVNIKPEDKRIWFEIELEIAINSLDANGYSFQLLGVSENGNSIIGFWVDKYKNTDDDEDSSDAVVPFQVAYAVSIHKAQGLEYKSVKIVITNEVEELITHNIFYTAITRAKEELKIYWTPETEKSILGSLKKKDNNRDSALLRSLYGL